MKPIVSVVIALLFATTGFAQERTSEHAEKALEIYRTIVEVDTSKHRGNTLRVAQYQY